MRYLISLAFLVAVSCSSVVAETTPETAVAETTIAATTAPTAVTSTSMSAPPPPSSSSTSSSTTSTSTTTTVPNSVEAELTLANTIFGDISPKSVVASGTGLFFAQNMMYRHTITVYDQAGRLLATIPDEVVLADHGFAQFEGSYRGSPVEIDFTSDGRYAYVSNYQMYGPGFNRAGGDDCGLADWDESFLYRIDTSTLHIDDVIAVGAVPKYLAVTPDDRYVVVANWCSYDVSVVDATIGEEIIRVPVGRHPRGIAVTGDSAVAYVAVMGGSDIAVVNLETFVVDYIRNVGANPRHLVLDPAGVFLYATLNGSGRVIKVDLVTKEIVASVATGAAPRSMDIAADGRSLYIVNYNSDTVSKVRTSDMAEVAELATGHHPIGVTYDRDTASVWVANYSGSIQVFSDT